MVRQFFYEIIDDTSREDGKPLTRIYITAKSRFSHREMFAKQVQILDELTNEDCPINGALQLAVYRDMSVTALCIAKIDKFSRIDKVLDLGFVHGLELVLFDHPKGEDIINWLKVLWKGNWTLKKVKHKQQ